MIDESFRKLKPVLVMRLIYALLFLENFKRLPEKLSIIFLKHGEKEVLVSGDLLSEARRICKLVSLKTISRNIEDYPCKRIPICKWDNGQCEFYGECKIKL